jgi:GTPase SAR1 family protein
MLVYDISDEESFFSLENWIQEIDKNASKGVKRFLIGNKNDLENKRQVSSDQGKVFCSY